MLTLAQLLTPVTREEIKLTILTFLSGLGFQATSWEEGSIQRDIIEGFADLVKPLTDVVQNTARARFTTLATEEYLNDTGDYWYDLPRQGALATQGQMVLTLSAAAMPASFGASELIVADAPEAPANTYRVTVAGAMNPGDVLTVDTEAETPGAAANIPSGSTLYLWTPIAGLAVTNPAVSGTSTWITREGQGQESAERYGDRMRGRWHRLSPNNTEGAYRAWALEGVPSMTRVTVREGPNDGEVIVTGATASGGLDFGQIDTLVEYLNGNDGVGRRPINDVLTVQSAVARTTPTLNLFVTCDSVHAATAAGRVSSALVAAFGALPIGGEIISPFTDGKVYASRIYSTVMAQTGIRNVTGIPADITLNTDEIYTPTINVVVTST